MHIHMHAQAHMHTHRYIHILSLFHIQTRKKKQSISQEGISGSLRWLGIHEVPVISLCLLFHSEATAMCCVCEFHKHSYVTAHEAVM